jgi:hypothetical protein
MIPLRSAGPRVVSGAGLAGGDLAALLRPVPTADVPAVRLYLELTAAGGDFDLQRLGERRAEVETAVDQLQRQLISVQKMLKRCRQLRPRPAAGVPDGI